MASVTDIVDYVIFRQACNAAFHAIFGSTQCWQIN